MAEQFQLDSNGTCASCKEVSAAVENLKCFMCNTLFHCACPNTGEDDKVGTKSLITAFNRPSTKRNFKFLCDSCATKTEINLVNSETNRLNVLETSVSAMSSELTEIKNLLKKAEKPAEKQRKLDSSSIKKNWNR